MEREMYNSEQVKQRYLYKTYPNKDAEPSPDDPLISHIQNIRYGKTSYSILLARKSADGNPFQMEVVAVINHDTEENDLRGTRWFAPSIGNAIGSVKEILASRSRDDLLGWWSYRVEYRMDTEHLPLVDYFKEETLDEVITIAEQSGADYIGIYADIDGEPNVVATKSPGTNWSFRRSQS